MDARIKRIQSLKEINKFIAQTERDLDYAVLKHQTGSVEYHRSLLKQACKRLDEILTAEFF